MKIGRKALCLLLGICICISCFSVAVSAGGAGDGKGILAYGVDVSSWQEENIDWVKVKNSGIDFAILRCATSNIVDKCFEINYANAKAAGVDLGCYIYTYSKSVEGAKKDAQKVLDLIEGKQFEYPIYFDIEDKNQENLSRTTRTNMCLAFCDILSENGYLTGVYASKYYLRDMLYSDKIGEKYEFWMAAWTSSGEPTTDYSSEYGMWQYSATGKVDGIPWYSDLNVAYKNYPEIVKQNGLNGYSKEADYPLGDCDMNGTVDSNDALMILKNSVGIIELTDQQKKLSDVDGDGNVTSNDAMTVLKMTVGIA